MEAIDHALSKPDMFLLLRVLADVPVLRCNSGLSWVDAALSSLHITVDLDGIQSAPLVGVNPVHAYLWGKNK